MDGIQRFRTGGTVRVRSRAGLPVGPWRGKVVLSYRRTAWFGNEGDPLVGLLSRGMGPSPGGLELEGDLPVVRSGVRLESDGVRWILEGAGELEGASEAPDASVVLAGNSGARLPSGWRERWAAWFDEVLPGTPEGRWLSGLVTGHPGDWESLVGRGSGSTPLGDDYLAGWLAARRSLGLWEKDDRCRLLRSLVGTTRLSRHFLWHLADGRVDAALGAFLAASPAPEPGSPPAVALADRGDLSGRATLVGLVAGLTSGE